MALEEAQNAPVRNADAPGAEIRNAAADADATEAGTESIGTMAAKRYPVAPGVRLNVRSGPGTNYRLVKILPYGATVPINCQKAGETITGPYGTTNLWDNIANGQFVSDAYVYTGSDGYVAPRCS
ncbi:peptidase [Streptomyces peucetius]|uniref:Peptidase n=1 Tax=Streptomyces peucetius TaxID=1950 RepID=A0ABY6I9W0_STRPE|nr:peptidase [Streptomyces peucetius]UYQ63636.1 peptidase [Streptomyces peucetius]